MGGLDISTKTHKTRYIRPITRRIRDIDYVGFDIETVSRYNEFYMGSLVGDKVNKVFYDETKMLRAMRILARSSGRTMFVATNLGFDAMALLKDTDDIGRFRPLLRGSSMISGDICYSANCVVKMIDTGNFLKMSVADMGDKILGIPKLPRPRCLGRYPDGDEEELELMRYNLRDSEITYKTMRFIRDFYLSTGADTKKTIGSTAVDYWRRNFLDRKIAICPYDELSIVRQAFYGGRTEAFIRGTMRSDIDSDVIWRVYDINSLYPAVMRDEMYPDPDTRMESIDGSDRYIYDYHGISLVDISCPDILHKPLLPYRTDDGRLVFPSGRIDKRWYSHVELRKAIELGYVIHRVHRSIYYTGCVSPFKGFVDTLYKRRMEFKKMGSPMELMCKLTMNNLYGKFSQRPRDRKIYHVDDMSMVDRDMLMDGGYMESVAGHADEWLYFDKTTFCDDDVPGCAVPIWGVMVTAYGRLRLYDAFTDDTAYCDTDSVFTTARMPTGDGLGEWKLEHELSELMVVRPKFYRYKTISDVETCKIKGVPKRDARGSFMFFMLDDDTSFKSRRFSKFLSSNRKINGRYHGFNEIYDIEKRFDKEDMKRDWDGLSFDIDGMQRSRPWRLKEGMLPMTYDKMMRRAEMMYHRDMRRKRQEMIDSDHFDNGAVGSDISAHEHIDIDIQSVMDEMMEGMC